MLEFEKVKALADRYSVSCESIAKGKFTTIKVDGTETASKHLPKEFLDELIQLKDEVATCKM